MTTAGWALAALVIIAAVTDLRARQIPNWLTLGGVLAGLALHAWLGGWSGLGASALGFAAGCVLFLPLFALRWIGGGDAKLMIAIGALAGWKPLLVIFLLDAVLGGVAALGYMLARGRVRRTLRNLKLMLVSLLRGRAPYQESAELEAGSAHSAGLPRAVTIALATLIVVWGGGLY